MDEKDKSFITEQELERFLKAKEKDKMRILLEHAERNAKMIEQNKDDKTKNP